MGRKVRRMRTIIRKIRKRGRMTRKKIRMQGRWFKKGDG